MVVGLNLNNPPALESKRLTCLFRTVDSRPFAFEAIVLQMSVLFTLSGTVTV